MGAEPPLHSSQIAKAKLARGGKKRTRTGCLNCRRKRRKCDERKPTCEGCQTRREVCEWGVKVSFRPENAHSMGAEHPSMVQAAACNRCQSYQIINVTKEVIRDYFEEFVNDDRNDIRPTECLPLPATQTATSTTELLHQNVTPQAELISTQDSQQYQSPILELPDILSRGTLTSNEDIFLSPQDSESTLEDGIFLPGSQYQELSATLRSRLMNTARSTVPSRLASPEVDSTRGTVTRPDSADSEDEESRRLAQLSVEHEFLLWQNYIDEVASWLDKFDINRHFELVLPVLAKSHPHLRYSILAISARQMELRARSPDYALSLALYQHAIHLLSPLLQERTTVVLASCVVLCVLEMMSCSPKAWKRHLDGCAALVQALGIAGCCGGLEQALFWCFARMDICGGLIGSERTLIPMHKWLSGDIRHDCIVLEHCSTGSFDMYANRIIYLCGQVIDLLCRSGKWDHKQHHHPHTLLSTAEYEFAWSEVFTLIENWYHNRPEQLLPLFTIPSPTTHQPFPTLFFGNAPATSGNQMYHTAALLMLKHSPSPSHSLQLEWHARQICAISLSNGYHSCWTNSIQPLWIAGQEMKGKEEREAVLGVYERIERETGWATGWRAEDLRAYWRDEPP